MSTVRSNGRRGASCWENAQPVIKDKNIDKQKTLIFFMAVKVIQ